MVVNIEPFAADLLKTASNADPDIGFLAALQRAVQAFEAINEGHTMSDKNFDIAKFHLDRTIVLRKKLGVIFPIRFLPDVLEGAGQCRRPRRRARTST